MIATTLFLVPLIFSEPTAPPNSPPPDQFVAQLEHVEVVDGGGEVQLVAYDGDGEIVGMVAIWPDDTGAVHIEADFADGWFSTVIEDERESTSSTLPGDVLARRADAMIEVAAAPATTTPITVEPTALGCAVRVAVAVGLCAPLAAAQWWGVATCPAGVVSAWCKCAPVLGLEDGGVCKEL